MKENFYSYISPTISTIMLALVVLNLKPSLRHSRLFLLWPRPGLHDTIFYNRSSLPLIRLQITSRHWFRYISQDSNNSAAQTVSTGMLWRCWTSVCHIKKEISDGECTCLQNEDFTESSMLKTNVFLLNSLRTQLNCATVSVYFTIFF